MTTTETVGITPAQRTAEKGRGGPCAVHTAWYDVVPCRACHNAVVDVAGVTRQLTALIERSGWRAWLSRRCAGRPRAHQKFRIAVAGCPNACSEPHIRDFGVVGRRVPEVSGRECNQCLACVTECREAAVAVTDQPRFDRARCVNCGACIRVCPTGALQTRRTTMEVVVGGKLGRHPRLADTLLECDDRNVLEAAFLAALDLVQRRQKRLGDILALEGLAPMRRNLVHFLSTGSRGEDS